MVKAYLSIFKDPSCYGDGVQEVSHIGGNWGTDRPESGAV